MAVRRLAPDAIQPAGFAFSPDNRTWAAGQVAKYPQGRQASAVIPLLWQAQKQADGWLPRAAIEHVAEMLGMPKIRVLEVATFYTMFNLEPVGKHYVQLCGTTPCALRGAESLKKLCESRIGPQKKVTADGKFSWIEVECLGACCNAPMVQINDDFYEDLSPESFNKLLDDLSAGRPVKIGPQNGRRASEPEGSVTTLADPALFDGSLNGKWRARFDGMAVALNVPTTTPATPAPATPASTPALAAKPVASPPPPAPAASAPAIAMPVGLVSPTPTPTQAPASTPAAASAKPRMLAAARSGGPDDLKLIWGVGPKLEQMLHRMGVFHFDQIAVWTTENLTWVDANLTGFRGRAERDQWIMQSKKLATGWRPENTVGDKPKRL